MNISEIFNDLEKQHIARTILEALPEWFGIVEAREDYIRDSAGKPFFCAYEGQCPVGFLYLKQTGKDTVELAVMGVCKAYHRTGIGAALFSRAKEAARQELCQDILLEINIANEESKSGFSLAQVHAVLADMGRFPSVRVCGFMAIPPICQNPTDNHKFFQEIYQLSVDITAKKYDNVCVDILSMGMSGDYEDAIRCGSTMIRVGTAIFGAREYK